MTPHPSTTYDATVRKQAAHLLGLYGLGHARALASAYATKAKAKVDRDFWTDVLAEIDRDPLPPVTGVPPVPTTPLPPHPAPEGQPA